MTNREIKGQQPNKSTKQKTWITHANIHICGCIQVHTHLLQFWDVLKGPNALVLSNAKAFTFNCNSLFSSICDFNFHPKYYASLDLSIFKAIKQGSCVTHPPPIDIYGHLWHLPTLIFYYIDTHIYRNIHTYIGQEFIVCKSTTWKKRWKKSVERWKGLTCPATDWTSVKEVPSNCVYVYVIMNEGRYVLHTYKRSTYVWLEMVWKHANWLIGNFYIFYIIPAYVCMYLSEHTHTYISLICTHTYTLVPFRMKVLEEK